MRETQPRRLRRDARPRVALALAAGLALSCKTFSTISILAPLPGFVTDDPSIALSARVATAFDPLSVEVRIDGVDLIAALGLTPPFSNVSGTVSINGTPVQVAGFRYDTSLGGNPKPVDAVLAGLPEGDHDFAVSGVRTSNGQLVTDQHAFAVSSPLGLALGVVPAAATRAGALGGSGSLAYATFGGPVAGPPVGIADGGALREGF